MMDPRGLTPTQIYDASRELGEPAQGVEAEVGQENGAPLFYTGSGQDELREELTDLARSESNPARLRRNHAFAQEIGLVTFQYDEPGRRLKISVTSRADSASQDFEWRNVTPGTRRFVQSIARRDLAVDAICMDRDGGCRTAQVVLKRASGLGVATAYVIARQTPAYLFISGNPPGLLLAMLLRGEREVTVYRRPIERDRKSRNREDLFDLRREPQGTGERRQVQRANAERVANQRSAHSPRLGSRSRSSEMSPQFHTMAAGRPSAVAFSSKEI